LKKKNTAIIVAAGSGKRIGGSIKKQFLEINGKPVLRYTLEKFQRSSDVDSIIVVVPEQDVEILVDTIPVKWGIPKVAHVVAGGKERQQSVYSALKLVDESTEIVLIHDGVRPFVRLEEIEILVKSAREYGAAVIGITPKDTIKQIDGSFISESLNRQELLAVQTPQVFKRDLILRAFENNQKILTNVTDDASLVDALGEKVYLVKGGAHNIKITTPEDLWLAEKLVQLDNEI
jgi:2-C-methyl-D-erythritol 4-phosphate cytidylyltransferase